MGGRLAQLLLTESGMTDKTAVFEKGIPTDSASPTPAPKYLDQAKRWLE